ncbi:class I adenylate-forming enzyme family protein [Pseudooceanicola sp.]|uniref:class I adenylate-forming enzyme family protein n=1 Tax=Pseudooceanicola sp. TaxID=1914328 RepID=UPI0035C6C383
MSSLKPEASNGTVDFATAVSQVVASDPRFRLCDAEIRGERYRVFENAPRTIGDLLLSVRETYGDRDLLVYGHDRWSYAEFCRDVARMANALRDEFGLRQGDRFGVAMRNYPEMAILILAAAVSGIVAVPMNGWWSAEELAHAVEDCDLRVIFADGPRAERLAAGAGASKMTIIGVRDAEIGLTYRDVLARAAEGWPDVEIQPDDDFVILYSSGSTGHPKGVIQTHRNAITAIWSWSTAKAVAALMNGTSAASPHAPAWLIISPLFHVTALNSNLLQGLANGAKLILMYKWDVEDAIQLIARERVTRVNGVPTQTADLAEAVAAQDLRFDHLEAVSGGGAHRPAAQVRRLKEVFPSAAPGIGWGMTETSSLGITLTGDDYLAAPTAAGRLTPPVQQARIVDAEGRDLPEGEVGELLIRSAAVMRGYLNAPEATAEVLRDGWLHTGDLARVGPDGLYYLVDRKKSIVIRGGENVSCLEVEHALHEHGDVLESCVFAVPDSRLGETVGAAVLLRPGATLDAAGLDAFLTDRLAHFKRPEAVWFFSTPLPRGATGKIDRSAIRRDCISEVSNRAELA